MASSPSKLVLEAPLTISALLNSLHTHLQTQTQLLPTLHAQLGLPQSALTDELSALQQKLTSCVEQQIESRREEVEKWISKCDSGEKECTRYTKALGGHVKAIGASLGELRKQQVLPVRHEMVNQYQEKLNQLYKTKLEQLSNLANRVTLLSRTLGSDFFPRDITEPQPAQGENGVDIMLLKDVTPERFSRLEKELVRGKSEISRRLQCLSTTLLQMDWLYHELGIAPPSYDDTLSIPTSSSSTLMLPTRSLSVSTSPSDPFLSSVSSFATPTPSSRKSSTPIMLTDSESHSDYHRIFALFVLRVDEAESEGKTIEPSSLIGVEGVEPTVGLLNWAEQTKADLEDIKKRRETHIQAMYDQLETLWKRLGVEDADIDEFIENNRGSTDEVIQAYESELERMLELKRERMSVFINNARSEIEALWNDLMVGEEERADFAPFADDEHTEELLSIHENEIRKLKEERRLKAPLLTSIRKYFEICGEEKELAAAAMDQNRLLGRGSRDPGRLLREEKMRKRVNREKPRLEQDLMLSIPAWEEEHRKPFLVNGTSIIEILAETISAADKENARKKPRAGSVPPRATTPSLGGAGTNMGKHIGSTAITPGVHSGSNAGMTASHSVPNKRTKLATSHSGVVNGSVNASKGMHGTYDNLPHRMPFGSRAGVLNTTSPDNNIAVTHKTGRTPSSSLPRPVTTSKSHHPPLPQQNHAGKNGYGIGLGYASTLLQNRAVSTSSVASESLYPGLQPKRSARNNRRESFRPRQSTDGPASWTVDQGPGRYADFRTRTTGTVEEEDEY